jgi:hypothetical protein
MTVVVLWLGGGYELVRHEAEAAPMCIFLFTCLVRGLRYFEIHVYNTHVHHCSPTEATVCNKGQYLSHRTGLVVSAINKSHLLGSRDEVMRLML